MKNSTREAAKTTLQKDYFLALDKLLSMPPLEWLVKDLIPKGGVGVLYGASGSLKSFLALHLSLCCATGRDAFLSKPCKEAPAFYIAAEGAGGFKQRVEAWMKHYEITPEYFYLRQVPVYIAQEDMLKTLMAEIKERNPLGEHSFVVIDTLSTSFTGDENSNDIAKFMQKCTQLSKEIDATVMIVHHTGKDQTKGARGHTSLIANADFVIYMKNDHRESFVKVEKLKESPTGLTMNIRALCIPLDPKAEIASSLVIEEAGGFSATEDDSRKDLILFRHLADCHEESVTQKTLVQQLVDHYGWDKGTADKTIRRFLPDYTAVDIGNHIVKREGNGRAQRHIRIQAKDTVTSPM
ncbi:MAG: AAA family ATPase [Alphaproteobacteria bacterium]